MLQKIIAPALLLVSTACYSQGEVKVNTYKVFDSIGAIVAKMQVVKPYAPNTLTLPKGMTLPLCIDTDNTCPDTDPVPPTYYYRSIKNGDWNQLATWQWSSDSSTWSAASALPDKNANTIIIQNDDTVTVTAAVTIDETVVQPKGVLMVASGVTLTVINNGLLLQSTATGTATIGRSAGTINGNVMVEDFIPARRAWRLLTAPLSNANTIQQAWQNGGTYTVGRGTFITGPSATNGLDAGNTYSLKTFDVNTQQLVDVTNTNVGLSTATGSADNKGYFIFIRGDRNTSNLKAPNTNITTLSATGALQTGTQTFTASSTATKFTLIGNPYVSPVDFGLVTRNNVAKRFYAWDPALNTVGGYVTVDDYLNTGTYTIIPASTQTNVLQPGQAFFVQTATTAAASITFEENDKPVPVNSPAARTNNGSTEVLRTSLFLRDPDSLILADGVINEFNTRYSNEVGLEDAAKMQNINESLAIDRKGSLLSIERRSPLVDGNDTMFLRLNNTSSRNYRFRFEPANISPVVSAWLEDSYLATSSPISLTAPTNLDFSMVANTASADANRFRIVFKTSSTLPISTINIKAAEQNAGIQVDWNIATESDMKQYELERSVDGHDFTKLGTTAATGNTGAAAQYGWFDAIPFTGSNFYRVKAVSKTGETKYSAVVIVKTGDGKQSITVYPNPVVNKSIYLQLSNEPKGRYMVELFDALGQKMLTKTIDHAGGSSTHIIRLGAAVSIGVYQLHVVNGSNQMNEQVIIR